MKKYVYHSEDETSDSLSYLNNEPITSKDPLNSFFNAPSSNLEKTPNIFLKKI
jgi:hypothetical protein